MLVKVAAATRAGLLPEDYFLYWEDIDWCWRLRQAGYQCVVVPTAKIVHLRGRSSTSELAEYYLLRNGLLFHRRVGSPWQNMRYLARYFFRTLPAYLWKEGLLQRRMPQTLRVAARAVSWNISDAVARAIMVALRLMEGHRALHRGNGCGLGCGRPRMVTLHRLRGEPPWGFTSGPESGSIAGGCRAS